MMINNLSKKLEEQIKIQLENDNKFIEIINDLSLMFSTKSCLPNVSLEYKDKSISICYNDFKTKTNYQHFFFEAKIVENKVKVFSNINLANNNKKVKSEESFQEIINFKNTIIEIENTLSNFNHKLFCNYLSRLISLKENSQFLIKI